MTQNMDSTLQAEAVLEDLRLQKESDGTNSLVLQLHSCKSSTTMIEATTNMRRTEASDKGIPPGVSTILEAHVKDRTTHWPAPCCSFSKHSSSTAMHNSLIPSSAQSTSMAPTPASKQTGKSHHALPQLPSNHHPRLHTTAVGAKATTDGTNRK